MPDILTVGLGLHRSVATLLRRHGIGAPLCNRLFTFTGNKVPSDKVQMRTPVSAPSGRALAARRLGGECEGGSSPCTSETARVALSASAGLTCRSGAHSGCDPSFPDMLDGQLFTANFPLRVQSRQPATRSQDSILEEFTLVEVRDSRNLESG